LFAEVHSEKSYVSIEEELKGWNGCSLAQIFALATISLESLKRITQEWKRERERERERELFSALWLLSSKWGKSWLKKGLRGIYTPSAEN